MKSKLIILLALFTCSVFAQPRSAITSKEAEIMGKYVKFWMVDQDYGYTLGKNPVKYEPGEAMPQVYFTKLPTDLVGGSKLIVNINAADNTSDAFYCLSYIPEEKETAFGRRRFLQSKYNAYWEPIVEHDFIVIRHQHSGLYLKIDENGEYKYYSVMADASRWELIYL